MEEVVCNQKEIQQGNKDKEAAALCAHAQSQ